MPIHRWMASAAGGTNQRLKPGLAMMRLLSSQLDFDLHASAVDMFMAMFEFGVTRYFIEEDWFEGGSNWMIFNFYWDLCYGSLCNLAT